MLVLCAVVAVTFAVTEDDLKAAAQAYIYEVVGIYEINWFNSFPVTVTTFVYFNSTYKNKLEDYFIL